MSRNGSILLVAVIVLGYVSYVLYQKRYNPKFDWHRSYNLESVQPYGIKFFYELLEAHTEEGVERFDYLYDYNKEDSLESNTNYVCFQQRETIDSLKAEFLLNFAFSGNNVLIISNSAPLEVLRTFIPSSDSIHEYGDVKRSKIAVEHTFNTFPYNETLTFYNKYIKDTVATKWSVYSQNYFNERLSPNGFIPLSNFKDKQYGRVINMFYVNHGKGKIIFHTNKLLFSNIHISSKQGFKHLNNVLSLFEDNTTYWDVQSDNPLNFNRRFSNPIKFLFSDKTLRSGWYLLLITVLLYVLFRSKRQQRIIPILPSNNNSTIGFAKTIGLLYFQKGSAKDIAEELYMQFLTDIRTKYHINTKVDQKELIEKLYTRSGVDKSMVEQLFKQFTLVRKIGNPSPKDVNILYNMIEHFNKNRK